MVDQDQDYRSALAWALLRHDAQDRRRESIGALINKFLDDHQTIKEATQTINPHQRVFLSALTLTTINLLSLEFLRQVGAYTQAQFDEQVAFWRGARDAYEATEGHGALPELQTDTVDDTMADLTCRWALGSTAEEVVADLGSSAPAMRRQVLLLANQWRFDWLRELGLTNAQVEEMQAHMPRLLRFYEDYLHPATN